VHPLCHRACRLQRRDQFGAGQVFGRHLVPFHLRVQFGGAPAVFLGPVGGDHDHRLGVLPGHPLLRASDLLHGDPAPQEHAVAMRMCCNRN
jgi:hypothetical protein